MRKWLGVSVRRTKLFTGLLLILFGTLIVYGFWKFGTILGFFLVYPWMLTRVSGLIINPHLANIVALAATVVIYFGVYHYVYRRNKNYGYACLIGLLALHSVFLFFSEKNRFYSQITGEPIKYYTVNPIDGEYQVFEKPTFDAFGQRAKAVDFRTAQEIYRQEHSDQFPNKEVPFSTIENFFDQRTGQAFVYHYQNASGYHFFMHDGFDPVTGRRLYPVTPEVIEKCNQGLSKAVFRRIALEKQKSLKPMVNDEPFVEPPAPVAPVQPPAAIRLKNLEQGADNEWTTEIPELARMEARLENFNRRLEYYRARTARQAAVRNLRQRMRQLESIKREMDRRLN